MENTLATKDYTKVISQVVVVLFDLSDYKITFIYCKVDLID